MVNICDICAALHQNSKVKLEIGVTTQYIAAVVQAKLAVEQFCMRFSLSSSSDALTQPRGSNFFSPAIIFYLSPPLVGMSLQPFV